MKEIAERKFCIDCKHAKVFGIWIFKDWDLAKCHHPKSIMYVDSTDDVRPGKVKKIIRSCGSMRYKQIGDGDTRCGPEGQFWEAKE